MKKILFAALLAVGTMASAQIQFGLRANALFNTSSPSWENISNTATGAFENPKSATGFNVGVSAKISMPLGALFIMPEIYYTQFKNEVVFKNASAQPISLAAKSKRLDIPVMVGLDIIKPLGVFIGPVFSTNLGDASTYGAFKEEIKDDFTVGYQFGANLRISKLVVNARYEGAFSKDQREFLGENASIKYDSRPSFFIVGLGYNF